MASQTCTPGLFNGNAVHVVGASDDNYSSISISPVSYGTVAGSSLGFSIPSNAIITGIAATIEMKSDTANAVLMYSYLNAGGVESNHKTTGISTITGSDQSWTFGGTGDLWGLSPTPAQINAAVFSFSCSVYNPAVAVSATIYVDYIAVTVYYEILPTVTTQDASGIGTTTATGNATITDDGGTTITERGLCWNYTGSPTKADNKVSDAVNAEGVYAMSMTGLPVGRNVYAKGFATNAAGDGYGDQVTFRTFSPGAVF